MSNDDTGLPVEDEWINPFTKYRTRIKRLEEERDYYKNQNDMLWNDIRNKETKRDEAREALAEAESSRTGFRIKWLQALNERDEARRWARKLLNACGKLIADLINDVLEEQVERDRQRCERSE